mgnify:CR=1 FL=1
MRRIRACVGIMVGLTALAVLALAIVLATGGLLAWQPWLRPALMTCFVAASPFGASVRGTRDQPRRMNALGARVHAVEKARLQGGEVPLVLVDRDLAE